MVDFDKLRAIAEGPALDLPPMAWMPPDDLTVIKPHPFAVWGDEDRSTLRVYLDPGRARIWYGDRLYEFRMWDKGYLCGVEAHTAPGDPARARAEANAAKTEADLREWRALAREFQAEASR